MATTLTPSQMAAHVDLSLDTLRYYERVGLKPRVQRLPNGHRRCGESDIEWLAYYADTFRVTAEEPTP